jgi:hypothetical protein
LIKEVHLNHQILYFSFSFHSFSNISWKRINFRSLNSLVSDCEWICLHFNQKRNNQKKISQPFVIIQAGRRAVCWRGIFFRFWKIVLNRGIVLFSTIFKSC